MKKLFNLLLLAVIGLSFNSCSDDDSPTVITNPPEVKSGIITASEKWTNDRIWELSGKVVVPSGVTLTIEPGTIIKGREGAGTLASALIISRGATINAHGTAAQPIIFTSVLDNIEAGEKAGTNLTQEDSELWGGVVLLGAAPVSAEEGDEEAQVEGIPAEESFGRYGGTNASDNSGILQYVSIRHGGVAIGAGNELNGLTLGGVGNGTTINNVEIFATLDDGIEFFGGTVNATNLLVYWQGDDGIDIDQNYSGTVDNFMVIHGSGVGTDEGLEIDGPEGTLSDGLFHLKNGTIISDNTSEGSAGDFKSKAQGIVENVVWKEYNASIVKIRASYSDDCTTLKEDAFTHLTNATPTLQFINSSFGEVNIYTSSTSSNGEDCSVSAADQTAAENTVTIDNTASGADASEFEDWTITSSVSELI